MRQKSVWLGTLLTTVGLAVVLGVAGVASLHAATEKKISLTGAEVPAVVHQAIQKAFPQGEILAVEKEVEGENPGQYDVEVQSGGKRYEVEIAADGKLVESKEMPAPADAPVVKDGGKWSQAFDMEHCSFSSVGRNRFFSLEPGHQLVLESKSEKIVISVLDETRKIDGIETRVVEEHEEEDGEVKEVSRNFFAFCKEYGDIFYFGEEVDEYKDGKIVSHGGAWIAGEKGAKAGIIMPGRALVGARHYQELAPNAQDRAEIVADNVTLKTPAGEFTNCIKVEETSPLEPGVKSYKIYAPGVGLIQDEDLLLTRCTPAGAMEEKEETVSMADLPAAVRATLQEHAAGGKITEIEKAASQGSVVYEAELVKDGKTTDIRVSASGKFLGTEEDAGAGGKDEEEGKEEEDKN